MAAYFWYIALGIIGIGEGVFVLYKKRNYSESIAFFLCAMMLAFACEMIVLLFFNAYSYKPRVFTDYYAENIFGHVIPNSTLWPATALLAAAFRLRYRWIALIAVVFTLLDILFVQLGIYQHLWWQTWMTTIGIFGYCVLMQRWYALLKSNRPGILRYIAFWFILLVLLKLPETVLLFTGAQYARVGLFENLYRDAGVFSVFYSAALSLISTFFLCVLKKWCWKLVPFPLCFCGDAVLFAKRILFFQNGWNIGLLMLVRIISFTLFIALEHKYPYRTAYPEKSR